MATWPAFSYPRYLASKKTVDDKALNRAVLEQLRALLAAAPPEKLRVLEVGGGIGTMVERLLGERMFERFAETSYEMIDSNAQNVLEAARRVRAAALGIGFEVDEEGEEAGPAAGGVRAEGARAEELAPGMATKHHHAVGTASNRAVARRLLLRSSGSGARVAVVVRCEELEGLLERAEGAAGPRWDVLVAAAFLDLVDIPRTLPRLLRLLRPGGAFYFPINFDGATHFEPNAMGPFDDAVEAAYHASMDAAAADGLQLEQSRAGRTLFREIARAGGAVARAGGSSWAVFPSRGAYEADEAYFLHCILAFVAERLAASALDPSRAQEYIRCRREQVAAGELVYVAHNLDFAGTRP